MAVIGGGGIGVSCAYELARRGASVTLLEAGPEVGAGCSAGSAGLVCPSHSLPLATRAALLQGLRWSVSPDAPFALRPRASLVPWLLRFASACTPARERAATDVLRALSRASLELFGRLCDEAGVRLERSGTLNVYETERSLAHGRAEAAAHAAAGMRLEHLTPAAARALEPALQGPTAGAIYYPDEMSGDPLEFVRTMARAATGAGAVVRPSTEVLGLRTAGRRVVAIETTTGEIAVETVVLAAGAWSPRVADGLGLDLPVEGGKGYHVEFDQEAGDPRIPIFLQEARIVVTPLAQRLRLAGTLELAGFDLGVDRRRVDAVVRAGVAGVRGLEGRTARRIWRGLRPCSPDGLPIVGRTGAYENLVLATGHAALGFLLAPVTGLLIAQLVAGEKPDHDVRPLAPDRFRSLIRAGAPHA